MIPAGRRRERQRGFALLIVLWTMALMTLIGTQITAAGNGETRLAANVRLNAMAQAAADGAIYEAIFHLLDGSSRHWLPDSLVHRIKTDQAVIEVQIDDESRKLTLNNSSLQMLRGLMRALGLEDQLGQRLADEIADWRSPASNALPHGAKAGEYRAAHREYGPPNAPFRSVGELSMLLSMTPEVFARLRPYVSPYVESAPKLDGADPVIAAALNDAQVGGPPPLAFDEAPIVTITALAVTGSARFARRAVVRVVNDQQGDPNVPQFLIMDWTSPEL